MPLRQTSRYANHTPPYFTLPLEQSDINYAWGSLLGEEQLMYFRYLHGAQAYMRLLECPECLDRIERWNLNPTAFDEQNHEYTSHGGYSPHAYRRDQNFLQSAAEIAIPLAPGGILRSRPSPQARMSVAEADRLVREGMQERTK